MIPFIPTHPPENVDRLLANARLAGSTSDAIAVAEHAKWSEIWRIWVASVRSWQRNVRFHVSRGQAKDAEGCRDSLRDARRGLTLASREVRRARKALGPR